MKSAKQIFLLSLFLPCLSAFASQSFFSENDVCVAGTNDIFSYRIPVMETTNQGTVLAFCEARKISSADHSPTAIVLRRSCDLGQSWSGQQIIIDAGDTAMMAPTVVIDREINKIFLFVKNVTDQRVLLFSSIDDGVSWSGPDDITGQVGAVGLGPNTGVQLRSGRLVVPVASQSKSHIMYSDDHGESWHNGLRVDTPEGTNECVVAELADGRLMLNMRSNDSRGCRIVALSSDGGKTWAQPYNDYNLADPRCNAALKRYTKSNGGDDCDRLLFSNCNSSSLRKYLTVKVSYDEGQSWAFSKLIHDDCAGYSSLTILPDGSIGLLYEQGSNGNYYEKIVFVRFNIEWLSDGEDFISDSKSILFDTDFSDWQWEYDDHSLNLSQENDCLLEVCGAEGDKTLKVTSVKQETSGESWNFNHGIVCNSMVYSPLEAGAIKDISFSIKHERLDNSNYQVFLPMIKQDGKFYVYSDGTLWVDSGNDGIYTEFQASGLCASDWHEEQADGVFSPDASSNPDFSEGGSEVRFGVLVRAGGKKISAMNSLAGFDDLRVIIEVEKPIRETVSYFGHINKLLGSPKAQEIDIKDYALPNPEIDNAVRVSAPSPFTGFVEPNQLYSSCFPLPEPKGIIVTARKLGQNVNVLFKDGSTGRVYCPIYGTRDSYSNYDELEFCFVSTVKKPDGEYEKATVSHVGFVFESVLAASIEIEFYDIEGNEIFSNECVPTGDKFDAVYVANDETSRTVSIIHKVVFSPVQGYLNNDYWAIGSTLGLPEYESGLVWAGYKVFGDCPDADLNGDCEVNWFDFAIMSDQWLK